MLESLMQKRDCKNLSKDSFLQFNEPYLIQCNVNDTPSSGEDIIRSFCLSLGCIPSPNVFKTEEDLYNELISNGVAVATRTFQPSFRNCFYIKSIGDSTAVRRVVYGEAVYLCLQREETDKERAFLNDSANVIAIGSRPSILGEPGPKSGGCAVFYGKIPKETEVPFVFHWKLEHFNPKERLEYEGTPVKAGDKVIIKHIQTNQALSLEPSVLMRNVFGSDYEVCAKTHFNSHKAEQENNIWHFCEPKE
nr:unnamed protein product [Spirometra erinaceieuropaei]